ncbi:PRC-barrel domain-containing protein [Palleronia marisminoris]|uniref:PRC-barrel domain protein n=1 Tax=Palleronia marisminoris TaxID=315423 RepID=A0A1Y5T823_9RHOB|nr:PRC-barrel domain-containing protein [Palleronia marisminoris]SFH22385.1 PRC-barrel domain-containing protein [Palleronia marisminoris]SLN57839.1 PRC-barrel domain protein [Palleronia marisminoris]
MKLLTATTLALATATGSAAFAEQHVMENEVTTSLDLQELQSELIRSRDITGSPIYSSAEAQGETWDSTTVYDTVGADWNQIGEIEDIVLDQSGEMRGIVAEVGGFLDIADKHVLISVDDVSLMAADEYAYVTRLTEEELEAQQDVDEGWWD